MTEPVLSVRDLKVEFPTRRGTLTAIDGVSFDIAPGAVRDVVGESGAGTAIACMAAIGLHSAQTSLGTLVQIGQKCLFAGDWLRDVLNMRLR